MLESQNYYMTKECTLALKEYVELRRDQPHFANARSIRNALDRARLRHANRVFKTQKGEVGADTLSKIEEEDIRASRVFKGGIDKDLE